MKVIIALIATFGAMSSYVGSAIADVSISINFGSRPSYSSPNYYNPYPTNVYPTNVYRSNIYRSNVYRSPSVVHSPSHNSYYNRNFNSGVKNSGIKVREVYPSRVIYSPNVSDRFYNSYRSDQYGDRYIIEKRIIRVR